MVSIVNVHCTWWTAQSLIIRTSPAPVPSLHFNAKTIRLANNQCAPPIKSTVVARISQSVESIEIGRTHTHTPREGVYMNPERKKRYTILRFVAKSVYICIFYILYNHKNEAQFHLL